MWKFRSPYEDLSRYLNKRHAKTSGPNKGIVLIFWLAVIIAFIIALVLLV
jgi:hypothetical protein